MDDVPSTFVAAVCALAVVTVVVAEFVFEPSIRAFSGSIFCIELVISSHRPGRTGYGSSMSGYGVQRASLFLVSVNGRERERKERKKMKKSITFV